MSVHSVLHWGTVIPVVSCWSDVITPGLLFQHELIVDVSPHVFIHLLLIQQTKGFVMPQCRIHWTKFLKGTEIFLCEYQINLIWFQKSFTYLMLLNDPDEFYLLHWWYLKQKQKKTKNTYKKKTLYDLGAPTQKEPIFGAHTESSIVFWGLRVW